MADQLDHFVGVDFHRFKAFANFSLSLRRFNVLVGPNNAGKSTVVVAFRILAAALRKATVRKAEIIPGPLGPVAGYSIDLSAISIAEENLAYNYDYEESAWIRFRLGSGNSLFLYFPQREVCFLIPDAQGRDYSTPTLFKAQFKCPIGFVPILGPVEHKEHLYERETARRALFNYGAARNFRNIWHHFPEEFERFKELINRTWPGMGVSLPEIDPSYERPVLHMWCPEGRIPREIFWAGFGFQVWCQMLTHLIQSSEVSIFLIDEPDIYLHSDLQRQLVGILRELGPDILLATHSTEIITEADTEDILVVDKRKARASRLKSPTQLELVFRLLGSTINPILTQLAKTRRVIFVEGLDFHLLARFARKLGLQRLANRADFAVVPLEGFNPDRIRTLKRGIEATLGVRVLAAAVLDRDYRPEEERNMVISSCADFCSLTIVHESKELENFVLVAAAIDRAAAARLNDRAKRGGAEQKYEPMAESLIDHFAAENLGYVENQYLRARKAFERSRSSEPEGSSVAEKVRVEVSERWKSSADRVRMIPGKEALSFINKALQERYGISITASQIVDAMRLTEIPDEIVRVLTDLDRFCSTQPE